MHGGALLFNDVNARVTVPDAPSLHLTSAMTLEAWVKPTTVTPAWRDVIYKYDDNYYLEATSPNGGRPVGGAGSTSGPNIDAIGPTTLTANAWTHLATTFDGATQRLYVNGIEVSSVARTENLTTSISPLEIGGDNNFGSVFTGTIDEVRIYNVALTAAEIQGNLLNGRMVDPSQLACTFTAAFDTASVGTGKTVTVSNLALTGPESANYALASTTASTTAAVTAAPLTATVTAASKPFDGTTSATLTSCTLTGLIGAGVVTCTGTATFDTAAVDTGKIVTVTGLTLSGAAAGNYMLASTTATTTASVTSVNRAPTLTSPGNQTSAENAVVSLALSGSDPDGNPLTYSVTGLPPGLGVNASSGLISGTVSYASAATYPVTATVSDGTLTASQAFTWTVTHTNRAPTLTNPGAQTHGDMSSGYAPAVLADAPLAYWRLDGTSGASDSAGLNPGALVGGVLTGQPGALADANLAMRFDGSTGYVQAANPAALLTGDLTIELWLNVSLATRQTLISKDYLHEFELTLETTGLLNFYQGNGTTYQGVVSAAGAVTANTWQHVVVTRTAATNTIRFYVNGIAKGSGLYSVAPTASAKGVSIGRSGGGYQYVNGRLDEVALYPLPLTPAQVAAHYALATSGGIPTVVAVQLAASDPDGDPLTYSATNLPAGLTVNPATGLIAGTLASTSAGTYQVTATASDGSLATSQTFTWTVVTHVNRAPSLSGPGNQTSAENAVVSLALSGSDPDGNPLTYSVTGLPPGLGVNASSGLISGTVSYASAATYPVTATVSDGTLTASQAFTWTVTHTNRAPTLTNPGAQTHGDMSSGYAPAVLADAPLAYWRLDGTSGASDSAGLNPGALVGGVLTGQPGALADANLAMRFDGSTGYVQAANPAALLTGDLTIELWLNVSLATRQTLISKDYLHEFELTLETTGLLNFYQGNGTTYQGVVSAAGAVTANTWQHVVVTRTAATNTIRFYVNGIAKGSGLYSVAPTASAKGVSIGRSGGGYQYVNGRLDEVALYPLPLTPAQVAAHYALATSGGIPTVVAVQLAASDPDGDPLTYSATNLPAGLTVNPATGLIAGTLASTSAGTYQVTATASDGSLATSQTFTWTVVTHVNRAPSLSGPGNQTSAENAVVSLALSGSDPDGNPLTYSVTGLPPGLGVNASSGLISGTVSYASAATYPVTATVSDGTLTASQAFTWTVTHTNRAPTLTNPGAQTHGDMSSGYAPAVLADAPLAYWRLDGTSGASDSAGLNPGALVGGVLTGQPGALADANLAMRFDGSTGYVQAANPAALLTGDLTIELWLNVSLATRQTLISKDYLHEFELTLETTGLLNFYQGNGTTYQGVVSAAGAVTANTWQHVVVTRTAATNTIRFYVNGIAKGSGLYSVAPTASAKGVSIGRSGGGYQYVNGRLDEVALYPLPLTPAQVAAHYALATSAGTPTVVALQLAASDPDGAPLTYSATNLPAGLTVNAATGLIAGTLASTSAGTYQVTATVSDGTLTASQTFTWTVTHINRPPVLANPGNQTAADNGGYPQAVVADAPVAYWRLGDTSGTTAADRVGTNSGTLVGGLTLGVPGALAAGNSAMQFDGVDGTRVAVPGSASLGAVNGASAITMEAWVNPQTLTLPSHVQVFYSFPGQLASYLGISDWDGSLKVIVSLAINGVQRVFAAGPTLTVGTWYHVVATYDGAALTLYVNGTAVGQLTGGSGTVSVGTGGVWLGGYPATGNSYSFNGLVDEAALYTHALSPTLVATHYALRTSGPSMTVSLPLVANDPDGDAITYNATGLPTGLTINPTSGLISGTLPTGPGSYTVTVTASDGSLTTSQTFTWTLSNP